MPLQVAGLTNNSYVPESHEVRSCVHKHHSLGKHVLDVAKVDDMFLILRGFTAFLFPKLPHAVMVSYFSNLLEAVGSHVVCWID